MRRTHGMSTIKPCPSEYAIWFSMKGRCHCPTNQRYSLYGARGIRVCDRWFENAEDEYSEFPHEYTDEFGSRCRKQARQDGWRLFRDGKAMCPKCRKSTKETARCR